MMWTQRNLHTKNCMYTRYTTYYNIMCCLREACPWYSPRLVYQPRATIYEVCTYRMFNVRTYHCLLVAIVLYRSPVWAVGRPIRGISGIISGHFGVILVENIAFKSNKIGSYRRSSRRWSWSLLFQVTIIFYSKAIYWKLKIERTNSPAWTIWLCFFAWRCIIVLWKYACVKRAPVLGIWCAA